MRQRLEYPDFKGESSFQNVGSYNSQNFLSILSLPGKGLHHSKSMQQVGFFTFFTFTLHSCINYEKRQLTTSN